MGKKVDTYPIKYVLYDNTKKITKIPDKDKTKFEEYTENLRDLKTSWLAKMGKNNSLCYHVFQIICCRFGGSGEFFV